MSSSALTHALSCSTCTPRELRFPIMKDASTKTRKLEVACFAKEPRTDDLLGKGTVDITETLQTGEFDDWVKLNIDGVERGEIYLEMTYFSAAPPPKNSTSSSLLANQNLTRRPSKLPASERLWRPPQTQHPSSPPTNKARPPGPESQSSHLSPKNAPLPPLPKHQFKDTAQASLPEVLLPGGSNKPKQRTGSTNPPSVPGIGFVPTQQASDLTYRPSASPPLLPSNPAQLFPPYTIPPFDDSTVSANPNPYLAQSTTPFPMPSMSESQPDSVTNHPPLYDTLSLAWDQYRPDQSGTGLPFPTYGQNIDSHPIEPYERHKIYQPVHKGPSFSWSNTNLEDRYQKALPLPQESQSPLTSFDKQPVPHLDSGRLHNLMLAEKDAAQRKEQEKRDLELALQLDKELNT